MSLDRLLAALDVHVEAFAICDVRRGWRLTFDPDSAATAHYGLMGSGVMRGSRTSGPCPWRSTA
jgi:AraC family transcriptional regulator, activator of mtrCDE